MTVEPVEPFRPDDELDAGTVMARAFAGFVTLRRHAAVRAVVLLGAAGGIVKGIGDVIFVTFSDARLDGGGGQSGVLAGAYGVGAVAGAAATTRLVHGRSVPRQFTAAGLLAGVPLVALAGVEALGPALVAFAVLGAGETLLQLTSTVTLQRLAPPAVLARLFGILEGIVMGCIALGSIAVTVFVAWTSVTTSFVLLAALVIATVLAGAVLLARSGGQPPPVDDDVIERILTDPVFAPLPAPTIERLGRVAEQVHVAAGDVVVAEGEAGDRYYLVRNGELAVTVRGRQVRALSAGDAFGEIALLRDVPRTATVTARGRADLLAVARDDFLEAVTGHPRSLRTAEATADRWLA
jgi:hypothetical protein